MPEPIVFQQNEETELVNAIADRTLVHSNLSRHVLRTVVSHIFKKCIMDINDYRLNQVEPETTVLKEENNEG